MMEPTWWLLAAIASPVTCGLVSLLLPRRAIAGRVAVAILGPVLALGLLGSFVSAHGVHFTPDPVLWMPTLKLNLAFHPDQLGLFFAFLVAGIGLLIVLYARAYFGPDADSLYRFYPYLHLFMTAMLGVALADNTMLLLLFWEMTSISSFLLIGWERDQPQAVRNAMQAFITTALGGLAMMAGLIILGVHTGQWTFTGLLAHGITANPLTTTGFLLIFVGAGAKSAQFPFQFWLPGAMAAPTPVSAYLHSATMVKAGVYLTGRLWPILAAALPAWPMVVVPIGALTMLYGAFIALQKTDLKQIFAYTTVSQLGLLMCMYGLSHYTYEDQPNLIWDVTQILNHALYKAPLFILAGAIGHVASRELPELRGFFHRGKTERIMATVILAAGYALAAGPFTLSFSAKEMFFYQIYHALEATHDPRFWLLVLMGILTGMFNVAIFIRLARTLLAKPEHHHAHGHDDHHGAHGHGAHGHGDHGHETGVWPAFLWIPGAIIVSFQYLCGIIPTAYDKLFGWLEPSMEHYHFHTHIGHLPMLWDAHPGLPLYMSLIAITLGLIVGFSNRLFVHRYDDPFDHAYPGFYTGVTKIVGPNAFAIVQTGHMLFYVCAVAFVTILLFLYTIDFNPLTLQWPAGALLEPFHALLSGYLLTAVVCVAAVMLPVVSDRASRVLILGTVGFSVTGVYFLYKAPDLALTQVSIEIVSLILFLLVLALLPDQKPQPQRLVGVRLLLSVGVGLVFFWLTLTCATATRPVMPYTTHEGAPLAHLGEYFLRNSYRGVDTLAVAEQDIYGGVVRRHGLDKHAAHGDEHAPAGAQAAADLHPGGGGNNVVNVILVDFRGFDTMGEITVLGLAAMGVWTLLRRHRGRQRQTINHSGNATGDDDLPGPDPHDQDDRASAPTPSGAH